MGTGPGRSPRTDRGVRRQSTQQAARTAHRARRAGGPGPHPSSGGERRTRSPGRATDGTGASPAPCGTDRLDQVQLTTWSKPRVERPMPYVRDSFWRGREFTTLEHMEVGAVRWCRDVAGARSCRSLEGAAPAAVFAAVEAPALRPLPATEFVLATWATGKVGPDIHVKIGPALYSVPWRLIGQRVHARSTATMVQVVHDGKVVATHVRRERGTPMWSTTRRSGSRSTCVPRPGAGTPPRKSARRVVRSSPPCWRSMPCSGSAPPRASWGCGPDTPQPAWKPRAPRQSRWATRPTEPSRASWSPHRNHHGGQRVARLRRGRTRVPARAQSPVRTRLRRRPRTRPGVEHRPNHQYRYRPER